MSWDAFKRGFNAVSRFADKVEPIVNVGAAAYSIHSGIQNNKRLDRAEDAQRASLAASETQAAAESKFADKRLAYGTPQRTSTSGGVLGIQPEKSRFHSSAYQKRKTAAGKGKKTSKKMTA